FFFQAEDGIRDFHVTGVQTCALPISLKAEPTPKAPRTEGSAKDGAATKQAHKPKGEPKPSRKTGGERLVEMLTLRDGGVTIGDRSEERRVGKECRDRWSPEHDSTQQT